MHIIVAVYVPPEIVTGLLPLINVSMYSSVSSGCLAVSARRSAAGIHACALVGASNKDVNDESSLSGSRDSEAPAISRAVINGPIARLVSIRHKMIGKLHHSVYICVCVKSGYSFIFTWISISKKCLTHICSGNRVPQGLQVFDRTLGDRVYLNT